MKSTPQPHRTLTGRIIVVQEQRFRVVTDDGRGMVFTLGTFAKTTMGDLARFKAANAPVIVHYTGEPSFASGVAQRVEPHKVNKE